MDSSASTPSTSTLVKPFLLVLLFLFVASFAIPKGQDVLLINGNHSFLADEFFKTITNLGDGLILIPILIVALFLRFRHVIAIAFASIAVGLTVSLFKRVIFQDMVRPRQFLDNDLIHFVSDVKVYGTHSFPSGHTATAFCAALIMALLSKNKVLGTFSLLLAMLVGYSRIYLAQHFLMDVAAGAVIGCFITYIAWQLVENSNLPRWTNRKLSIPRSRFRKQKPSTTTSQA